MSSASRRDVLAELRQRGFRSDRRRGQNFLFDRQLLDALIDDSDLPDGARVVEIGAGAGTLTERLLARGHPVVAVEIERLLCRYLEETLFPTRVLRSVRESGGETAEVDAASSPPPADAEVAVRSTNDTPWTLIEADVLATKNQLEPTVIEELQRDSRPIHLVANLPYAVASSIVQLFLELTTPQLNSVGVLVQREAADRWCAGPGTKEYGAISVLLALMGDGSVSRRVGRQLFTPPPKVESAFYTWRRREGVTFVGGVEDGYRLARDLFLHRRKTVRALLRPRGARPDIWERAGVAPDSRPEQVDPAAFVRLAAELRESASEDVPMDRRG